MVTREDVLNVVRYDLIIHNDWTFMGLLYSIWDVSKIRDMKGNHYNLLPIKAFRNVSISVWST